MANPQVSEGFVKSRTALVALKLAHANVLIKTMQGATAVRDASYKFAIL